MAITYVKDTFADFSTPDIDEVALNKITTALDNVCQAASTRTGTLDANLISNVALSDLVQVSISGIGSTTNVACANCDTTTTNAIFSVATGITGWAFTSAFAGILLHFGGSGSTRIQLALANGTSLGLLKVRVYASAAWGAWKNIWTEVSDLNAGQLPAAKSNKTSNTTVGWFDAVDCVSGGQVTLPAGGTFEWFVTTYGATYNSTKSGVSAGGLMTGTASANLTMYYKRLT